MSIVTWLRDRLVPGERETTLARVRETHVVSSRDLADDEDIVRHMSTDDLASPVETRALAILRAREEFAKRFGVSIRSVQTLSTTVANDRSSTVGSQTAREDLQQNDIKAVVKAKWHDPDSDVLWVWLVPSDQ